MGLIAQRVESANLGNNPYVIAKMPSGWAVLGDTQPLAGYCLLLADPIGADLNALSRNHRTAFLEDMARLGDAIIQATDCVRINYEILGNLVPELHAHLIPRYLDEPEPICTQPPMIAYDWQTARKSEPTGCDQAYIQTLPDILLDQR